MIKNKRLNYFLRRPIYILGKRKPIAEQKKMVSEMNKLNTDMKSVILNRVTGDYELTNSMSKSLYNYLGKSEADRINTEKLLKEYHDAPEDQKSYYFRNLPLNIQMDLQKANIMSVPFANEISKKIPQSPGEKIKDLSDQIKALSDQVKIYKNDIDNKIQREHNATRDKIQRTHDNITEGIKTTQNGIIGHIRAEHESIIKIQKEELLQLYGAISAQIRELKIEINNSAPGSNTENVTKINELQTIIDELKKEIDSIEKVDNELAKILKTTHAYGNISSTFVKMNENINDETLFKQEGHFIKYSDLERGILKIYKDKNTTNLVFEMNNITRGLLKLLVKQEVKENEVTDDDIKNYYIILKKIGYTKERFDKIKNNKVINNKFYLIKKFFDNNIDPDILRNETLTPKTARQQGINTPPRKRVDRNVLMNVVQQHQQARNAPQTPNQGGNGIKIYTSKKEIEHRLKLLQGSIDAGNNSKEIKTEISKLKKLLKSIKK